MRRLLLLVIVTKLALSPAQAARPPIVAEVRSALGVGDFAAAERLVSEARQAGGNTAENLEALSWLARGHLAAKHYDEAERFANETRKQALALLQRRKLDDDDSLPLALGASIEVHAQQMAAQGQRQEALVFLKADLARWHTTSIRTRIQKNINLLSIEGKPASLARLQAKDSAGAALDPAALRGKPLILFFWAHWCSDCKQQGPILARIAKEYGSRGLQVVAPTQHYGYVAGGEEASPDVETRYIREVFQKYYAGISDAPAPITDDGFKDWGASTTPTLALVDRKGITRLYHPGKLTYDELVAQLKAIL